jgi:hypothetical protein
MTRTLAAFLLAALYGAAPAHAQAMRKVDQRVPFGQGGFVRIHNMAGSVQVIGWDRDTVAVTGSVWETKTERFDMHAYGDGVKMGVWDPDAAAVKPSVLEVRVPRGSHVWVKTGSADITIDGVQGGTEAISVTGRIRVAGTPREVFAESMGGAIDVAADTRTVRVATASGHIAVRGAIVDASARTVSGDLTVDGSQFERGRFESVDGDIRYSGEIGRGSWLDFINHSGIVEFTLPPKVAAEFVVSTFEGGLDDRYGVRVTYGGNKLKGKEMSFTIGMGGGHVAVRNFKGQVVLRRK